MQQFGNQNKAKLHQLGAEFANAKLHQVGGEILISLALGKIHLYVSKRIAKATNKEVEYTLRKGFDDAECREWIIKALKDHTVLSRQQINELLWSKLPIDYTEEQKLRKIGNLLTKMRKNKEIQTDENRLWHLSEQNENLSEFK